MKLSRFSFAVPHEQDDTVILFSCLSRAIVQVTGTLYRRLTEGDIDASRPDTQWLRECVILVDDDADEYHFYQAWYRRNRYARLSLSVTLVMTYDCNCACTYCYAAEATRQRPGERITRGMGDRIIQWMEAYLTAHQMRHLDLCFHGGEPLLNLEEIEHVGEAMKRFCREHRLSSRFNIVTNGTLLNPDSVARLVQTGIEYATVTLDGPEAVHNERRPFRDGQGSFRTILGNVTSAADRLHVHILTNLDGHNCESARGLADVLAQRGLANKVYGALQVDFVEPTHPPTQHSRRYDLPRMELARYARECIRSSVAQGFLAPEWFPADFCSMNCPHSHIIDPRGDIYKCITACGSPSFVVANIADDWSALARKCSQFVERTPADGNEQCQSCRFLPMCHGGCQHENWVRHGDMWHGACMRSFWEFWISSSLRDYVASRSARAPQ